MNTCSGVVGGMAPTAGDAAMAAPGPSGEGELVARGVPGVLPGEPRFEVVRAGGAPSCSSTE